MKVGLVRLNVALPHRCGLRRASAALALIYSTLYYMVIYTCTTIVISHVT